MRPIFLLLLAAGSLGGCGSASVAIAPDRLPYPIGDLHLPVYPATVAHSVRISMLVLVSADGTVLEAQISPSSGHQLWDSLAVQAVRSWQFEPAHQGDRAVQAWVRIPVRLRFADAPPLWLAEIVVPTRALADSLYALLTSGTDFATLARQHSTSATAAASGVLGPCRLSDFSMPAQMAITTVGPGHVAPPVRSNGAYIIYKRLTGPEGPTKP